MCVGYHIDFFLPIILNLNNSVCVATIMHKGAKKAGVGGLSQPLRVVSEQNGGGRSETKKLMIETRNLRIGA